MGHAIRFDTRAVSISGRVDSLRGFSELSSVSRRLSRERSGRGISFANETMRFDVAVE